MQQAGGVSRVEGLGDVGDGARGLPGRPRAGIVGERPLGEREGGPGRVLHAPADDRRDAGMAEGGGAGRDRQVLLGGARAVGQIGTQDLERDAAARPRFTGAEQAGQARSVEPRFDAKTAEAVAGV